jgi:hypothetical protein
MLTVFPRTSRFVTDGAKLSTFLCKRLEIKRITALQMQVDVDLINI